MKFKEVMEFLFVGPLFSVDKRLNAIDRKLENMANQADIDALAEKVGDVGTQFSKGLQEINGEISSLREQIAAGQQPLDLTVLQQKVDALVPVAQALDDVVADAPTEDPDPEPEPVDPEPNPDNSGDGSVEEENS